MSQSIENLLVILSARGDWKISTCRQMRREQDRRKFRCSLFTDKGPDFSEVGRTPAEAIIACLKKCDQKQRTRLASSFQMRIAR